MYNRTKKTEHVCAICGKTFYTLPCKDRMTDRKNIYCGKKCYGKAIMGANNQSWNGGVSFGKYCPKFNDELKEKVRTFFGHQCILCGKTEKELGYHLHVHHVDYDKEDGCNGRDPLFVPLCCNCHMKTNFDRDEWELFFRQYLAMGYNNNCY